MIAMGSYYEGVSKCLINYTNDITENIIIITWMLGVGGTSFKGGTVTVPDSVECNIINYFSCLRPIHPPLRGVGVNYIFGHLW